MEDGGEWWREGGVKGGGERGETEREVVPASLCTSMQKVMRLWKACCGSFCRHTHTTREIGS
jgi:hypothetical protein